MSLSLHATDRPVTSAAPMDGPGFAVAVAEAQHGAVRVPLSGRLDAGTARILTAAFAALHERPGEENVVLDLSALTFVDRIGMSILGVNRVLLDAAGRTVRASARDGPSPAGLRSLGGLGATAPGVHRNPALEPRLLAQERPVR